MADRSKAEAIPPERVAACPASLLDGLLLPTADVAARDVQEAAFSGGQLWVARGYAWRAVGGSNCGAGRRAAKQRCVRERAAEHGMLPAAALHVFHRGSSEREFCALV